MKNKSILLSSLVLAFFNSQLSAGFVKGFKEGLKIAAATSTFVTASLGGFCMYEANRIPKDGISTSHINTFGTIVREKEAKQGIRLNVFTRTLASIVLMERFRKTGGWND